MNFHEAMASQAAYCDAHAAPVTARVCRTLAVALDRSSRTGRRAHDWPGDYIEDAVPLRLVAPFHALHRARDGLAAVFGHGAGDPVAAIRNMLDTHDEDIERWLDHPPQTNEPARSAGYMLGLLHLADRNRLPFDLLEIGSSAGLNLLIDRIGYTLGNVEAGAKASPIHIVPEWRGLPPPAAPVHFAATRGCDIAPLDLREPCAVQRLIAYVWADAPERIARAEAAAALWHDRPPTVDRADAADWVEARLAEPQLPDVTRVVAHSVVWPYLSETAKRRIHDALHAAGKRATLRQPLAWLRYEWGETKLASHEIRVTAWPGGVDTLLGYAHPHGAWIASTDTRAG